MEMIDVAGVRIVKIETGEPIRGGVVIAPSVWGVNDAVVRVANILGQRGYTSVIWDPYPGRDLPETLDEALTRSRTLSDHGSIDALSTVVTFARDSSGIGSVGALGFCLGGRFSLLLAAADARIQACCAVYPTTPEPRLPNQEVNLFAQLQRVSGAVSLVVPGRDTVTARGTYERMYQALGRREDAATFMHLFPSAPHGFAHDLGRTFDASLRTQAQVGMWAFFDAFLDSSPSDSR